MNRYLLRTLAFFSLFFVFMSPAVGAARPSEFDSVEKRVCDIINTAYGQDGVHIIESEIDLSEAVKIYVGKNALDIPGNDFKTIKEELENGGYMYILPVKKENYTFLVSLSKGRPLNAKSKKLLSEEEQKRIKEEEGLWIPTELSRYESGNPSSDIFLRIDQIRNSTDGEILLIGGLPIFVGPCAVIADDGKTADRIVSVWGVPYESEEVKEAKTGEKEYDYEKIRNYATKKAVEELYQGESSKKGIIGVLKGIKIVLLTALALVVGTIVYRRFKRRV